jgi:membrane-associated phospholipid phosphatase
MAVALAEMYPKNIGVKIAAYSYATLTGIGMSLFAHWASDTVAGALIGYAIGKSVGKSFKELLDKYSNLNGSETLSSNDINNMTGINITKNLSFYIMPNYMGLGMRY